MNEPTTPEFHFISGIPTFSQCLKGFSSPHEYMLALKEHTTRISHVCTPMIRSFWLVISTSSLEELLPHGSLLPLYILARPLQPFASQRSSNLSRPPHQPISHYSSFFASHHQPIPLQLISFPKSQRSPGPQYLQSSFAHSTISP